MNLVVELEGILVFYLIPEQPELRVVNMEGCDHVSVAFFWALTGLDLEVGIREEGRKLMRIDSATQFP